MQRSKEGQDNLEEMQSLGTYMSSYQELHRPKAMMSVALAQTEVLINGAEHKVQKQTHAHIKQAHTPWERKSTDTTTLSTVQHYLLKLNLYIP